VVRTAAASSMPTDIWGRVMMTPTSGNPELTTPNRTAFIGRQTDPPTYPSHDHAAYHPLFVASLKDDQPGVSSGHSLRQWMLGLGLAGPRYSLEAPAIRGCSPDIGLRQRAPSCCLQPTIFMRALRYGEVPARSDQ
jgi:hypothetical protein